MAGFFAFDIFLLYIIDSVYFHAFGRRINKSVDKSKTGIRLVCQAIANNKFVLMETASFSLINAIKSTLSAHGVCPIPRKRRASRVEVTPADTGAVGHRVGDGRRRSFALGDFWTLAALVDHTVASVLQWALGHTVARKYSVLCLFENFGCIFVGQIQKQKPYTYMFHGQSS